MANLETEEEGEDVREKSKMFRFRPILQIWLAGRTLLNIDADSTGTMKTAIRMIIYMGRTSRMRLEINAAVDEILKDPQVGILLPIWNTSI